MHLIIFEKSSQIKHVVDALGFEKVGQFFEGPYKGVDYRLVALAGHVCELLPPDVVDPNLKWDSREGLDKIPAHIPMRATPDKGRYHADVKKALQGTKTVVFGADPDREGIGIFFELLQVLKCEKPVIGLWFSHGLDPVNVRLAFDNMKPHEFFLPRYYAQQSRSVADYYWMYLVRLYTWFGRNGALGENLGSGGGRSSVVSVGRVQTTFVALIAERDELVKTYKPFPVYNFSISINGIDFNYEHGVKTENLKLGYVVDRDKVYFTDKDKSDQFRTDLLQNGHMLISSVVKKEFSENPPDVFSARTLWTFISKKLKFSPKKTQNILESLYRDGFVSYPRTDGTHIPLEVYSAEFVASILGAHKGHNIEMYNEVLALHSDGSYVPPVFRRSASAHEGIIPSGKNISSLDMASEIMKDCFKKTKSTESDVLAVFGEIYERFCIACLKKASGFKCSVIGAVSLKDLKQQEESIFKTESKFYQDLGFLIWHEPNKKVGDADQLFIPEEGKSLEFDRCKIKKSKTAKYAHYTEENITTAMENINKNVDDPLLAKVLKDTNGIGTPATIISTIDVVQVREYVEVQMGKFKVTQKGYDLLSVVDDDLQSPQLSAVWEMRLAEIENEKDVDKALNARDLFMAKQRRFIEKKVQLINERFEPKIGQSAVIRHSGDGKPSPKMVKYAKSLGLKHNKLISPKTLKSYVLTKKFIDKVLLEFPRK
jgi:DNA topoisomerase-3